MNNECKVPAKPNSVKEFFKSWYFWKPFLGILIGGMGGYLYFTLVGCKSGTCPITSSSYGTIITGSILGLILTNGGCSTCAPKPQKDA